MNYQVGSLLKLALCAVSSTCGEGYGAEHFPGNFLSSKLFISL